MLRSRRARPSDFRPPPPRLTRGKPRQVARLRLRLWVRLAADAGRAA